MFFFQVGGSERELESKLSIPASPRISVQGERTLGYTYSTLFEYSNYDCNVYCVK